jgi:conjugal transfer pilus assembly protein TraI
VALVVDTELRSNAEFYGQHRLGAHLERYLVDALRRLVASGNWTLNGQNSPAWHGADGMFLLWPRAAEDVVRLLERDQLTGIPKNPETILEILVSSRVVSHDDESSGAIVQIRPPASAQAVSAVRLSSESILTSALPAAVAPLVTNLIVRPGDPPPVAPSAVAAPAQQDLPIEAPGAPTRAEAAAPAPPPPDAEAPSPAAAATSSREESGPAKPTVLVLRPAARLKPIVHAALAEVIANLSHGVEPPEAALTEDAVFVPLQAFQRRDLDTALVVDALDSSGLLQRGSLSAKTTRSTVAGETLVGVLVKGSHITGFPARREPLA